MHVHCGEVSVSDTTPSVPPRLRGNNPRLQTMRATLVMSRTPVPAVPMPKARALAKVEQGEQRGEISGGKSCRVSGDYLFSEPWNARVRLFSTFAPLYDETNLKMQMFFCYLDKILRALMSAFCCFNQLAQNVREGCQRMARAKAK